MVATNVLHRLGHDAHERHLGKGLPKAPFKDREDGRTVKRNARNTENDAFVARRQEPQLGNQELEHRLCRILVHLPHDVLRAVYDILGIRDCEDTEIVLIGPVRGAVPRNVFKALHARQRTHSPDDNDHTLICSGEAAHSRREARKQFGEPNERENESALEYRNCRVRRRSGFRVEQLMSGLLCTETERDGDSPSFN